MATVTVEQIAEELRHLPSDKLAVVSDFVGYLRNKSAKNGTDLAEAGMADYLSGLQDNEERLARGEICWE
jgi:hypothetical protein